MNEHIYSGAKSLFGQMHISHCQQLCLGLFTLDTRELFLGCVTYFGNVLEFIVLQIRVLSMN